ncbi:MAG: hypothetical protein ACTTK5_01375 [Candidatus Fimenecus sp.]
MGGRGASSGMSNDGKRYGSEYTTLHTSGKIKFIIRNEGTNKSPMETMTKGRIYVTVDKKQNTLKSITFFDNKNKRSRQIDLDHKHKVGGRYLKPHIHNGYLHNEGGDSGLTSKDINLVNKVNRIWEKKKKEKIDF